MNLNFAGFYCKNCEGRVLEDEPYWDGEGKKMAVLTCLLCSRNYQCYYKDYLHLKKELERVILAKKQNPKVEILSQ